jgi:hypothetical protein
VRTAYPYIGCMGGLLGVDNCNWLDFTVSHSKWDVSELKTRNWP